MDKEKPIKLNKVKGNTVFKQIVDVSSPRCERTQYKMEIVKSKEFPRFSMNFGSDQESFQGILTLIPWFGQCEFEDGNLVVKVNILVAHLVLIV